MRHKTKLFTSSVFLLAISLQLKAQEAFTLKGEYRLNPLYSNGFRVPILDGSKPEYYTSQRTRIIFNYSKSNDLSTELILQDQRAWGTFNNNGQAGNLSIYRAWVEKQLTNSLSVKFGRQGLIYGEQFILGELNWGGNMAHDAILLKYEKDGLMIHSAFAYNTNGNDLKRQPYTYKNYKNMQFIWATKKTDNLSISAVFLNRGLEKPDKSLITKYEQTVGGNLIVNVSSNLKLTGVYYHQFGRDTIGIGRKINAFLYSAHLTYKASDNLTLALGGDVLSGMSTKNAKDPTYKEKNNFDIISGLRHGKYGSLDYFFTKLWPVSGVEDYYLKSKIIMGEKSSLDTQVHGFFSQGKIYKPDNINTFKSYYGTELDFLYTFKHSTNAKFSVGYSQIYLTDTYLSYYNTTNSNGSCAIYGVITISPTFFSKSQE